MNPHSVLTKWQGPLGLPEFTRVNDADFSDVFDAAITAHQSEIAKIAANTQAPSIENTLEALELAV